MTTLGSNKQASKQANKQTNKQTNMLFVSTPIILRRRHTWQTSKTTDGLRYGRAEPQFLKQTCLDADSFV
jgi:hypothetical protein